MTIADFDAKLKGYKRIQAKDTESKELVDQVEVKFLLNPHDAHQVFAHITLGQHLKLSIKEPEGA